MIKPDEVAVLLIVWRRPACTELVIDAIRNIRPKRIYVASDGPRDGNTEEVSNVMLTRKIVEQGIDWPCIVHKRYSDVNQGCRLGVSSAIDWFFECEPEGIILEDDIVPDPTFFFFCAELLARYRDDERIGSISAVTFRAESNKVSSNYYFSRYPHVWGWATWRRAWHCYESDMSSWAQLRKAGWLNGLGGRFFEMYWRVVFDSVYSRKVDTWDYTLVYSFWRKGLLTCIPDRVLAQNIGFGSLATHTTGGGSPLRRVRPMQEPLDHPQRAERDGAADESFQKRLQLDWLRSATLGRIKRNLGRLARIYKAL